MRNFLLHIITFLLTFLFFISTDADAMKLYYDGTWHNYDVPPITLKINGKNIETPMPPIVFGEYSLVPVREVFEALGAEVGWNEVLKIATISYKDMRIYLKINSNTARVNGINKKLDLPPKIINDKTMVPTRFVSEELGFEVKWDEKERVIYIDEKPGIIFIQNIRYVSNPLSDLVQHVSTDASNLRLVQVVIEASDKIDNYSTPSWDPYRIVVDIDNSILKIAETTIPVNENGIKQIRTSQFTVNPNKTRVVIDLQKQLKNNIYLSNDKKCIMVDLLVDDSILKSGEYVVVIDPGHGGSDPGAIYSGVAEKTLNLNIALKLKKLLEQENIKVYMTRENDIYVDLYTRSDLANKLNADLLVSIHNNAIKDSSYDGTMTLYYPDNKIGFNNQRFAEIMQKEVVAKLGTTDRGIRQRPELAVLRTSKVPAVLIEVAFMTNWKDMQRLKDEQFLQNAAEGLKNGIIKALNEKYRQ